MSGAAYDSADVRDVPERSRFELAVDGGVAFADYRRVGDALLFSHTEVPEGEQGQGAGGALVEGALQAARERGLQVMPICPFVAAYIHDHPEHHDLVAETQRQALGI